MKIFLWRCCRGALATKDNLHSRRCSQSKECSLCAEPVESIHHCLFECPHAAEGWRAEWPSLIVPPRSIEILHWIFAIGQRYPPQSIQKIIFLLWLTWKTRNEFLFKNRALWPPTTVANAQRSFHQWSVCPLKKRSTPPSSQPVPSPELPSPPPSTHDFEIHCDGSFLHDSQETAYGVVVTNRHGQVCNGKAEILQCFSPLEAEAKTLLEGTRLTDSIGGTCLIRSDCFDLVKATKEHSKEWPWRAAAWIGLIKQMCGANPRIRIEFLSRKLNTKADWVAKSCVRNQLPPEWINILDVIAPLL
ncbi:unnamed protein product [Linum trigynum]|uniref:Reverse transcriptase zinc-binding domain-containing protein n=1 Tax=Linum trigynum TaxID=586398 RepID=A0AAV2CDX5_9ROSI